MQQTSPKKVFREKSLERLASPDQLDQLLELTTPKEWVALIGLGSLLLAGVLWSIFGSVTTTMTVNGVLTRAGGLNPIESPVSGQVRTVNVTAGDPITDGQVIATVEQDIQGQTVTKDVTTPVSGRVLTITVTKGDVVSQGGPLLLVEPINQRTELVLYLSPNEASNIRMGMKAQISYPGATKEAGETMPGVVRYVANFPSTYQEMKRMLGTDDLVKIFSVGGPRIEVLVDPLPGAGSGNGHAANSSRTPIDPAVGTPCSVTIFLGKYNFISQLIPQVAR
jgi:hypothetical protein